MPNDIFVDRVLRMLRLGKFETARNELEQQKHQLPSHIVHECTGHILFFKERFQEAIDHYERAIVLYEERVIGRYQVLAGMHCVRDEDYGEAFRRYEGAMRAEPNLVEAYEAMAELMKIIGGCRFSNTL